MKMTRRKVLVIEDEGIVAEDLNDCLVELGYLVCGPVNSGVEAFKVVVDETNNTAERRDRNELWVSIFVKPTKTAEYIVLNLVVLRSEQSFALEEVLQAGGVVGNISNAP